MKAVMLAVPDSLLEERRRLGLDKSDEVWDGVLHMVPPPNEAHQRLSADLHGVLWPLARLRGLRAYGDGTGLFRQTDDYRQPDLSIVDPGDVTPAGFGRAVVVFEVLSPEDESRAKLPWYAERGVEVMVLVDPVTCEFEVFRTVDGVPVASDDPTIEQLGVALATVEGPKLRVTWDGGTDDLPW